MEETESKGLDQVIDFHPSFPQAFLFFLVLPSSRLSAAKSEGKKKIPILLTFA
jgi:hypothetical protein